MSRNRIFAFVFILLFACIIFVGGVTSNAFALDSSAKGAVLMEVSSGRVLYEKNMNAEMSMASTTKIMTALVVIENADLDEIVEIPDDAVGVEGSSVYLRKGEKLTVEELLYGLMLRSGNDCATALAIHVGGSVGGFVDMMNTKARSLGLCNTHFGNPHGLPCDNHYTSAHDLAVVTCNALKNDVFSQIVSTKQKNISNDGYDFQRVLKNKNKLLAMMEDSDGVKTGFTKKAGRCFVGSATRNGMRLVAVVLNCAPMFEEARDMLEYGFANYEMKTVIPRRKILFADFNDGIRLFFLPCEVKYPLKKNSDESDKIKIEIDRENGLAKVSFDKQLIFSQKMVTI